MAKKTRTELSTSAINTNLPDNTQELITPTTERAQLTDERESVINYKDDLGGTSNAGKFLTVATDGESLTMVDEPSGVPDWVTFVTAVNNLMKLTSGGNSGQIQFFDIDGTTLGAQISWVDGNNKLVIYNAQGQEEINLTGGKILLKTGGVTALTIDSSEATFNGDITLVNETTTTSQSTLAIKGKQTTAGNYPVGEIVFFNNNDSFATIAGVRDGANDKGALLFQTQNGTAGFGTRLTISSGGLATFQNGIKFGGTPSPDYDSGADTLDAYEEGTWTPSIKDSSNVAANLDSTNSVGVYTRVGNLVYFRATIQITSYPSPAPSSSSVAFIRGFPYTSATIPGNWYRPSSVITRYITFSGYLNLHVNANSDYGYLFDSVSASNGGAVEFSKYTSNSTLNISGVYEI